MKPVFGNNVTTRNNITLTKNEKVVTSEIELAKIFNKYFVDIVPKLGIKPVVSTRNNLETANLFSIIKKCKNHSIIIAIEKFMKGLGEKSFNFSKATSDIVLRNIQKENTKKASQLNDVPTEYIKKLIIVSPLVFFRNIYKLLKSSLRIRKTNLQKKLTTGRLVYFQISLKFMKGLCMII